MNRFCHSLRRLHDGRLPRATMLSAAMTRHGTRHHAARLHAARPCSSAAAPAAALASALASAPRDRPAGAALLRGLEVHTVPAADDGHPLAVYAVRDDDDDDDGETAEERARRTPVLLLHGRTWSSVAVYHLAGDAAGGGDRSLLRALHRAGRRAVQPYAMDFRGFGGTPPDASGVVEPRRCVADAVAVLDWLHARHGAAGEERARPALLGWSHGALVAQIAAQRHPEALSKLVLYGSIYNPNVKYALPPPPGDDRHQGHTDHDDFPARAAAARNEYDGALEDFTNGSDEGAIATFPPVWAARFAEAALACDPLKARWWNLHQLNECHPARVTVPTMVIAGDQDPYAPMQAQGELFTNLGRGVDRVWSIVADADHAVHLSDERRRFVEHVNNFLERHGA